MTMPITKKNMSRNSSRTDAFRVWPKICSPTLCLDNLMIRNTLTTRIICRYMISSVCLKANLRMTSTKKGMIARKSIQFMISLMNFIRLGHTINLIANSNVNHVTQMPSRTNTTVFFFVSVRNDSIVSMQKSMTDRRINAMLT